MAMREELALEHWRALRDVAISYDVHYDALLELVEDHTLYALYTDTDWYIEPDECARIPALVPQALKPVPSESGQRLRGPVTTVEPSTQVELPFTTTASPILPLAVRPHEEERREPEWLHFREAVRQSEFTHSELHRAVRQGEVKSMRHAQGHLLVCMQSLEDYTPTQDWVTLEFYVSSMNKKERRLLLKRLQTGEHPGRLMNGAWYLQP